MFHAATFHGPTGQGSGIDFIGIRLKQVDFEAEQCAPISSCPFHKLSPQGHIPLICSMSLSWKPWEGTALHGINHAQRVRCHHAQDTHLERFCWKHDHPDAASAGCASAASAARVRPPLRSKAASMETYRSPRFAEVASPTRKDWDPSHPSHSRDSFHRPWSMGYPRGWFLAPTRSLSAPDALQGTGSNFQFRA